MRLPSLGSACSSDDLSEDSVTRRQLLFSILAASGSPFLAPGVAEAVTDSATIQIEDWSNIDIIKPPQDDRDYLAFILDNGLKCIVCSDPLSNESGAAMDVHVGACSDPKAVKGLAHFK